MAKKTVSAKESVVRVGTPGVVGKPRTLEVLRTLPPEDMKLITVEENTVLMGAHANEAMTKLANGAVIVDKGEVIRVDLIVEKRPEKGMSADNRKKCAFPNYNLMLFFTFKKEFLSDKIKGKSISQFDTPEKFVLELAKEHEIGKYFHFTKGSAYGAYYQDQDTGAVEMKHEEYWMDGKRILEEDKIKRIIHDGNFNEKADVLING